VNLTAERGAWDEAAGRANQHRVAFEITDTRYPLGPRPSWGYDAFAASHRAASQASQRLDQALGRDRGIERSGPDLGLSR